MSPPPERSVPDVARALVDGLRITTCVPELAMDTAASRSVLAGGLESDA